jgi:hypothetical protein
LVRLALFLSCLHMCCDPDSAMAAESHLLSPCSFVIAMLTSYSPG